MRKLWYEGIMQFLCDFWYLLLILVVVALAIYFTRNYWMPLLFV